jgi:Tfp pilus assembly protein PilF
MTAEALPPERRLVRRPALAAGIVVALCAVAYLPSLGGEPFSDDGFYVFENSELAKVPLTRPWRFFTHNVNPYEYLPVRDLSYGVDLALFGPSPRAFHLHNLVLYLLACAAFFLAARAVVRLLRATRGDRFEGLVVAGATALFAAHPAHVESVAWIASRKDVLSGFFALCVLWQFAVALDRERPSWRRLAFAAGAYALGVLSKSTVIPLVAVLFLLAFATFAARSTRARALASALAVTAPFAILAAVAVVTTTRLSVAMGRVPADIDPNAYVELGRAPLSLRILGTFVKIALAPFPLRLHYDVRVPGAPGAVLLLLGLAAVAAAAWGAWALWRRRSIAGFGVVAFVILSTPFLQLVTYSTWSEASERWLFLPTLGLALAAGVGLARADAAGRGRDAALVGAAVIAAFLGLTAHRSWEWGSSERLVRVNLARAPGHASAVALAMDVLEPDLRHEELRAAARDVRQQTFRRRFLLIADGWEAIAEGRLGDAKRVVATLASFTPSQRVTRYEAALAARAGENFEALRLFDTLGFRQQQFDLIQSAYEPQREALRRRIEARPGDLDAVVALANLESELRMNKDAAGTYRKALALAPDRPDLHYNLAMVLSRDQGCRSAMEEYRLAARGMAAAWNEVALCERALGNDAAAEEAFQRGIAAEPCAWKMAVNLALGYAAHGRLADARALLLTARSRAAACGAPLDRIDDELRRLTP